MSPEPKSGHNLVKPGKVPADSLSMTNGQHQRLPRPTGIARTLTTGLVVGLVGIAAGIGVLVGAHSDRQLFIASSLIAGGAIFFGYSLFGFFYYYARGQHQG